MKTDSARMFAPFTGLKTHAAEIVDHARSSRRPVLLTRRGRGVAVLLSQKEYEELRDRAAGRRAATGD